jgi:hypothetical protein
LSSGLLRRVDWKKLTDVSEVLTACIIKVMVKSSALSAMQRPGRGVLLPAVRSPYTPRPPLFALMMEAVNTFEMPVSFYQTARRNIPKDIYLHRINI